MPSASKDSSPVPAPRVSAADVGRRFLLLWIGTQLLAGVLTAAVLTSVRLLRFRGDTPAGFDAARRLAGAPHRYGGLPFVVQGLDWQADSLWDNIAAACDVDVPNDGQGRPLLIVSEGRTANWAGVEYLNSSFLARPDVPSTVPTVIDHVQRLLLPLGSVGVASGPTSHDRRS